MESIELTKIDLEPAAAPGAAAVGATGHAAGRVDPSPHRPPHFEIRSIRRPEQLYRQSLSGTLAAVLAELAKGDASNHQTLALAIERDQALALSVCATAGSAFFRARFQRASERGPSVQEAVRTLGRRVVTQLVMRQGILDLAGESGPTVRELVAHHFVVAEIARALGSLSDPELADTAYLAGLVHDFGKLALLRVEPEAFAAVAFTCRNESLRALDAEHLHLACEFLDVADHAHLGAEVLAQAGLDERIVQTVRDHHQDWRGNVRKWGAWTLTGIVQVADLLAHRAGHGDGLDARADTGGDPSLLYRIDRSAAVLDELVGRALQQARPQLKAAAVDADPELIHKQKAEVRQLWLGHPGTPGSGGAIRDGVDACLAILDFTLDQDEADLRAIHEYCSGDDDLVDDVLTRLTRHHFLETENRANWGQVYRTTDRLRRSSVAEVLEVLNLANLVRARAADPAGQSGLPFQGEGSDEITVTSPGADLIDAVWSPDGSRLALVTRDGDIYRWDVAEQRVTAAVDADGTKVTALIWTGPSTGVLVGRDNGRIQSVTGRDWQIRGGFTAEQPLYALACRPADGLVACGGIDGRIQLRYGPTRPPRDLGRHAGMVRGLAWAPGGARLASVSADGTARLWDAEDEQPEVVLTGHEGQVNCLAWAPDGRWLATGSEDCSVRLWDCEAGECLERLDGMQSAVVRLSFAADGRYLSAACRDGSLVVWRTDTWQAIGLVRHPAAPNHFHLLDGCLAFNPERPLLAYGTGGGRSINLLEYAPRLTGERVAGLAAIARLRRTPTAPQPAG